MEAQEKLYYALGELASVVAKADGAIQASERKKLEELVNGCLRCADHNYNITEIIFKVMEEDQTDIETVYRWAIKEFALFKAALTPYMREDFVRVIEAMAMAHPPIEPQEQAIIDRFKKDLAAL